MIIILILLFGIIAITALMQSVVYVILYLPYVVGFVYGTFLLYLCKPLSLIIPEHKWLSRIIILTLIEIIIFILLHIEHTKKATIAILCVLAPAHFMTIFQITVASWQMALFLSILHIIVFGFEMFVALGKYKVDFMVKNGIVTTIVNALSYCVTAGMIIYSAFFCYWELYMNGIGKMATYTFVRNMIMIFAMMISFIIPIIFYILNKSANRWR